MHQLRQRRGAFKLAVKCIPNQRLYVLTGKGCKRDFIDLGARALDGLKLDPQGMCGIDFIVAISTNQHQVLQIRLDQQILQQVECGRVEPLQIVEKERQRMLGSGKDANESPEHELKTALCLLRLKFGERPLVADDE